MTKDNRRAMALFGLSLLRNCKNCGKPNWMHGVIEVNTHTGDMRKACEYVR